MAPESSMGVARESGWTLRAFRPDDEAAVLDLFERAFGRPADAAVRRWKLGRLAAGSGDNVWLGVDRKDRPIFQYAGIPCTVDGPRGPKRCMVVVDVMCDPEFQGQGLLTKISHRVYDIWRQAGVHALLGIPNERWGSRIEALRWRPLQRLQWQTRVLRPADVAARKLRLPWLARAAPLTDPWNVLWNKERRADRAFELDESGALGPDLDELICQWRHELPSRTVVLRNSETLQRRYLDHPSTDYRVWVARRDGRAVAYLVFRSETTYLQHQAFIAELLVPPSQLDAARFLLRRLGHRLTADGAAAVFALAMPGSSEQKLLRQAGFLVSGRSFQTRLVPLSEDAEHEAHNPSGWCLRGGDFDIV